jgi:hypothetical protein
MITKKEFNKRVKHNEKILKHALKNKICLSDILSKLYTWQSEPGELHFSVLLRNSYDIIPSAYLGALANINNNGIDAFIMHEEDDIEGVEIKTSEINSSKIWKGKKGGLYVGIGHTENQRSTLASRLEASYSLHTYENLESKNMRTVIFISDTNNTNTYIDAWEMDGGTVVDYLKRTDSITRTIKLGSFMKCGKRADTKVKLEGFEKFKARMLKTVPTMENWLADNVAGYEHLREVANGK